MIDFCFKNIPLAIGYLGCLWWGWGWGKAEMEAGRQSNEGMYPSQTGNATFTFVISFKYYEIVLFNASHSTKAHRAKAMI